MAKSFYLRMAANNLKRDKRMYVPFAISYIIFAAIYFMVITLMTTDGLKNVPAGESLQSLFAFGMVIMSLMAVIFLVYINSFLIKRRKKEFGLYGILGLEKRHVGRIIFEENLILSTLSLILGIVSGCVFGNLIFLLLLHTLRVSPDSRFSLPWQAFAYTAVLFLVVFVINTAFNFIQVRLANPIDLLKGGNIGEKKVRFIFLKSIAGFVMLVIAYYMANTVTSGVAAISKFFLAVLLVIAGTYLLFQAGSQFVLKILKGRKNFYYKAKNFIAVSGMFQRMKQNAAGLATICILSTMVLVTISTCGALYIGQEDILHEINPNDITITVWRPVDDGQIERITETIKKEADKNSVTVEDMYRYRSYSSMLFLIDGKLYPYGSKEIGNGNGMSNMDLFGYAKDIQIIPLSDYLSVTGDKKSLSEKEVLFLTDEKTAEKINVDKLADSFTIKDTITSSKFLEGKNGKVGDIFIVTADEKSGEALIRQWLAESTENAFTNKFIINLKGDEAKLLDFSRNIESPVTLIAAENAQGEAGTTRVEAIYSQRVEGYSVYGGLLFLGIFFTVMFLSATVLIIYFKQVSEGYDDRDRYVILQKVGMDDIEVKRTINRQILMVFFLPLLAAMFHVAAARHMIIKMLEAFSLTNVTLTTWCIIICSIVFTLIYVIVYKLTAKVYYKIIKF
ncbi:ABC transporter permease [Anaerocolumna xylanovorans]|uniref:Putative ABC transport system permease protein n=1 Tax=Anaerocolumna xylanovorans DSM 12503 TaxID=1121345 RepID=A0A1M7Y070_9FIRM|nr:FtsX-like permease family protein [Anaerocolumna xylanovorans]SHO44954.1 putative ABC transport system permease protein [Anaerocolumna xylanovorans DSM 12503]